MRDVDLKAYIAIVGTADPLTLQIDIAHIHDAFEIEEHPFSLPGWFRLEMFPVPTDAHLFESTATEATTYVGAYVAVVCLFVVGWSHPRLFDLKIMGNIDRSPGRIVQVGLFGLWNVSGSKTPAEVKQLNASSLSERRQGEGQKDPHQREYLFHAICDKCYQFVICSGESSRRAGAGGVPL